MEYGIKNKRNGLFFAGFDAAHNAIWGSKAMPMRKLEAEAQALLLARFDLNVQRKPVQL